MTRWQRFLLEASRSRRFLWRFALGMLLFGAVAGYALHRMVPAAAHGSLQSRLLAAIAGDMALLDQLRGSSEITPVILEAFARELAGSPAPVDFEAVLDFIPMLATWAPAATPAQVAPLLEPHFPPDHRALAADLLDVCRNSSDEARARLEAGAAAEPPVRYAAHALGLAALAREEFHAASEQFRREGRQPEAVGSRRQAVECLVTAEDFATLTALKAEPGYAELIPITVELDAAVQRRDWPAILRLVPLTQITGLDPAITALTLTAAVAWAFFLGHLGQVPRLRSGLALLCLLALAAGIASTTPTIYAVIWQDEIRGFSPEGDFVRTLVFYIGGVGVREEVCKLLLFVPFLPFLLRRDSELDALLLASFVGLGFAMEENGNYFLGSGGLAAATRFLTANFFHVALTGLNGLALYRACARSAQGLNEFLTVFGVTIIAHGLYDALLDMPDPALGGYLSLAVYVLTCQAYFSRAHALRDNVRMTISLTGAFVAGISLLGASLISYQMVRLGPAPGLYAVLPEFIGTIILLVMFFREFNEPLAE